jgi:hypothetical protein
MHTFLRLLNLWRGIITVPAAIDTTPWEKIEEGRRFLRAGLRIVKAGEPVNLDESFWRIG